MTLLYMCLRTNLGIIINYVQYCTLFVLNGTYRYIRPPTFVVHKLTIKLLMYEKDYKHQRTPSS